MSNYWIKRQKQRFNILDELIDDNINNLQKRMIQAADNIENEIMHLYIKYADDNNMSYFNALNYLTNDERKEFQKDLKYYINTYRDKEKALLYKKELHALSTRARVKRLELLKVNILKEANELYNFLFNDTYKTFNQIFEDSYLYNMFTMQDFGVSVKFDTPSKNVINELLQHPWSGSNYSDKVWEKTETFTKQIDKVMTTGLVQGKSIDALVSDMRVAILGKKGKGGRLYDYKRLVRTEAAYVAEQATIRSYKDCNIEKYEYLATLDLKTSKICQNLDGKIFEVEKAVTGINYPPMHAFCRSTTVPVIIWDGEDEDSIQRISRNPITRKNEYINCVDFINWKDSIYNKYGKDKIDTMQRMQKNSHTDKNQHQRYLKELHDMVPKSFDKFQDLKYNRIGEWEKITYNYKLNTVYNLDKLKNTENFAGAKSIKHILEGEVNKRNKAVGYHLENMPTARGTIVDSTRSNTNKYGIYDAEVIIDGVNKQAKSSFFPVDWTPQQVIDSINEAYSNMESYRGSMFKGKTSFGFEIGIYLDKDNKIATAFPIKK